VIVTAQEWVSLSVETLFSPRGYAVLRSFGGAQARQRISEAPPDLLVIDSQLRDMRGVDLCHAIRQDRSVWPATPILMISTSQWHREERLEALSAGAWDAVSLPMDGEELFLKADTWVRAKLTADFARDQGLLDAATGFYNAQGLLRRIIELGAGAGRHNRALACVVISIDADAIVAADESSSSVALPTTIADRLRVAGRASDTIGRLSPSEFVVVAPDTDPDGALLLARRLKQALESPPAEKPDIPLRFGYYGVPNFRDASIAPTELLIRAAEALRSPASNDESIRMFRNRLDTLN
jgi:two-component system cell cycle response regulator